MPFTPSSWVLIILSKGSIHDLNLSVGLRVGRWGVVILDPQLWAKFPEWLVVELFSVFRDQDFRDPVPTVDVSPDEASYVFLCDGSQGFSFHPFGKVIYANH